MENKQDEREFYYLPCRKLSRGENLKMHLWWFVQKYFVHPSPIELSKYRIFWLRLFGAKIGNNCNIGDKVFFLQPWKVTIGDNSSIDRFCYIHGEVLIGNNVAVGNNVHMVARGHNVRSRYFEGKHLPITIGNSVFIGGDAYIGAGVNIGQFSVIGAKSVVFKSIPENSISFGFPCEVKSERIPHDEYLKYRY